MPCIILIKPFCDKTTSGLHAYLVTLCIDIHINVEYITTKNLNIFTSKIGFQSNFYVICYLKENLTLVLLYY